MTAVEWLVQEMINNGLDYPISKMSKILEQAKEMEKQQIIDAHLAGQNSDEEIDGENELQYYKNTYGSKESGMSEKPNDHIVDSISIKISEN